MKVLYWNCRGFGNDDTKTTIFDMCRQYRPDVLCLAEPKVVFYLVHFRFGSNLNLSSVSNNGLSTPSNWVLVSSNIGVGNVTVISSLSR